ncbi:MAG: hypothetical protein HRU22_10035, partial [Gammaproteobacteria bacterium]|nr:hypothetical protein [Gammaproteobacteria bacterium]
MQYNIVICIIAQSFQVSDGVSYVIERLKGSRKTAATMVLSQQFNPIVHQALFEQLLHQGKAYLAANNQKYDFDFTVLKFESIATAKVYLQQHD